MDNIGVIARIIEAEQEAHRAAETIRERRAHLGEELEMKKRALRDGIRERAQRRIRQVIEYEKTEADETVASIEKQYDIKMEAAQKLMRERRDEWVETLFRRVIDV